MILSIFKPQINFTTHNIVFKNEQQLNENHKFKPELINTALIHLQKIKNIMA